MEKKNKLVKIYCIMECELISSSGNANTAPADTLHDKSTLFLEKIDVNVNI